MILPSELLTLIEQGEGLTVEFKKSTSDITKDVYETVCSFSKGDIFRTVIPLSEANSTVTVGPTTQVTTTADNFGKDEKAKKVLAFCSVPRSRAEIMKHLELANTNHFRKTYLKPLLESGKLKMTIPDKPNSRNQKYIRA